MNDLVREWAEKAEGDRRTARREAAVTEGPNWDAACFHAQQAVEKYIKSVLQLKGVAFSRIHDLRALLLLLDPNESEWAQEADELEWLSSFAVEVRYPGEAATEDMAVRAIAIMEGVCTRLRGSLDAEEGNASEVPPPDGTGTRDEERAT